MKKKEIVDPLHSIKEIKKGFLKKKNRFFMN
jgi:hypothetical protein